MSYPLNRMLQYTAKHLNYECTIWQQPIATPGIVPFWSYKVGTNRQDWAPTLASAKSQASGDLRILCFRDKKPFPKRLTWVPSDLVRNEYDKGECPDCQEPIPESALHGESCENCGHIWNQLQPSDDLSYSNE
jgi:hypothetical protein